MLPWVELREMELGPLRIQPFLGFLLAAVLAGRWALVKAATRRGFHADLARAFYSVVILASVLAGPAWVVLREPALLISDPRTWPGLLSSTSSWAGIAGGIAAALAFTWSAGLDRGQAWLLCDSFAWAFPFGWLVLRLGCAWTHHHPGIASASPLTMRYPDGARYDLALLEALLSLALIVLLSLARRRTAAGIASGVVLIAVGGFRYAVSGLKLDRPASGWELTAPLILIALGIGSILYGLLSGGGTGERKSKMESAIA